MFLDGRTPGQVKDVRYALAQLGQSQFCKSFDKSQLVEFIKCVNSDNFDGANRVFGLNLEKENELQRTDLIVFTVHDGEMMLNPLNQQVEIQKDTKFRETRDEEANEPSDKTID